MAERIHTEEAILLCYNGTKNKDTSTWNLKGKWIIRLFSDGLVSKCTRVASVCLDCFIANAHTT